MKLSGRPGDAPPQFGRTRAGKALHHAFPEAGRHTVTVMDDSGRYDRVEISVR